MLARSRGPRSIEVLIGGDRIQVPVPQVQVLDTLGAGDVLHWALSAWLAVRGTTDVLAGLVWAARVGAESCPAAGSRGWLADPRRLAAHRQHLSGWSGGCGWLGA